MSKALYLFVTSERPDPYVNAIAHCVLYTSVDTIVFIHIRGTSGNASEADLSAVALRNVQIQMDRLASGEYRYFDTEKAGQTMRLSEVYAPEQLAAFKATYARCLEKEVSWANHQIAYATLRDDLAKLKRDEKDSLFDVTSISKSLLGDVIAASILEGIDSLYTLDLRARPNFDEPWRMLLHEGSNGVKASTDYAYVNIVDTPVFRACAKSILVRGPRLVFPIAAAIALLGAAVADYTIRGQVTGFIQLTSIASGVASLLSLIFAFWPIRR
jgi:hypothetical protein